MPLIYTNVVNALKEMGVDNIDYYPTRIYYPEKEKICTSYYAINIIGLETLHETGGKAQNSLIFRMKESPQNILAHKTIKDYFSEYPVHNIKFIPLEQVAMI